MRKVITIILLIPIYFYRSFISPILPPACRYTPTCSQYAIEALKKHGPIKGLWLTVKRYQDVIHGVEADMIRFHKSLHFKLINKN